MHSHTRHKEGIDMKKQMKYSSPEVEFVHIGTEDILSLSKEGFEGEEHSFFGGRYYWGAEE